MFDNMFFSKSTKKTLKSLYTNHFAPAIEKTEDPEHLVMIWLEKDLAPATVRKLITIYRRWYAETYPSKPTPNLSRVLRKLNRIDKSAPAFWTKEQVVKGIAVARAFDKNLHDLIILGIHTGMRRGELLALEWNDVDFISGTIFVHHCETGPVTKTGKPRAINMSRSVEQMLMSRYEVGDEGRIFNIYDPNKKLKQICEIAEIPVITVKALRHSFATLALQSRRSPRQIATILGHSKISTLLNQYWRQGAESIDLSFLPGEES